MSVLDNFESWKGFLANKLEQAESQGMSQQAVSNMAYEVGDYLAKGTEAKNNEEAVLRELWNAADTDERHALANTMVKLVQNQGNTN
ncbi:Protein of unknown function [Virgibacillus subterraneus]|uniref:DUF3243 domain-containing protein n=3 Tax=Virgibacillus TaxID=84406 RepID=A0A1H1C4J8_9BACI|nr:MULTISPECIES: DUF3243 domain-containing protein [Virgibacillus]MBP1949192.1 two-component SAPR family response regulator [Virgibacillus litoralis]SDQ59049.1 Protein of unknown function [Virgibacillus salinus]SEQ56292.1 Protein of unknown function [Virgibacillus subterraneus]